MLRVSALGPHFERNNFHRYDRMMPLLICTTFYSQLFTKKLFVMSMHELFMASGGPQLPPPTLTMKNLYMLTPDSSLAIRL